MCVNALIEGFLFKIYKLIVKNARKYLSDKDLFFVVSALKGLCAERVSLGAAFYLFNKCTY